MGDKERSTALRIGGVELPNNLILAPMAGVSDLPFRLLCREMGAGLVCMEMISAKAISFNNRNTEELMRTDERERPVSLQLFGNDPEIISEMAARIEERPFDILDINMGCPVPKIVKNGEGSALMRDPRLVYEIVRRTASRIRKPVTVKIRKGFSEESVNAVEVALAAQEGGAAAVTVHGRTREQYYAGEADWEIIRAVREALTIPVIGNGDVHDAASARAMQAFTGCDGIMIGRAARGNPWIFREILADREGAEPESAGGIGTADLQPAGCAEGAADAAADADRLLNSPHRAGSAGAASTRGFAGKRAHSGAGKPSRAEVCDMILRHAEMVVALKGEAVGMREMRKHAAWYTNGFPHASRLRAETNRISTMEDLREVVELFAAQE